MTEYRIRKQLFKLSPLLFSICIKQSKDNSFSEMWGIWEQPVEGHTCQNAVTASSGRVIFLFLYKNVENRAEPGWRRE